jgi:hypothetical protein
MQITALEVIGISISIWTFVIMLVQLGIIK